MGPFDYNLDHFVEKLGYREGHWYVHPITGDVYLVPVGAPCIEGFNDSILASLTDVYRDTAFEAVDPEVVADKLGISVVADAVRRFSKLCGYYYQT